MPGSQRRSWLTTSAMMPAAPSTSTGTISFHDRPAKKITYRPADRIRIAVPRSGCLTTSPTGTSSSTAAIAKSSERSRPSRFWNHQASISGIAIFRISLGWITDADVEPARRALLGDAEHGRGDQQPHAQHIQRHRQAHQLLRRDLRHDEHERRSASSMLRRVVDEARAVVEPGRVHRDQAGRGQQRGDEPEHGVEAAEHRPHPLPQRGLVEDGAHVAP